MWFLLRTTSTTTGSRTWLKCAHVQKCHCFGFGRKQSGEVKAKNFLFPFHTPQEAKKNLERLAHFPPLPVEVGGEKKENGRHWLVQQISVKGWSKL